MLFRSIVFIMILFSEYFIVSTDGIAITAPSKDSQEFIEYTSETVNKLNDYALGGILPSLIPLMLYAYTQELMYIILFFFLLITSGLIIF